TAITRAPITGSILILEMTNSFDHLLALIVVAVVSYVVVDLLNVKSIYDYLLDRMIDENKQQKKMRHKQKKLIIEIPVAIGSKLEGKTIKDIVWPENCLIIRIGRGEEELLPKGNTELLQGDMLIILTDEESASTINLDLVCM